MLENDKASIHRVSLKYQAFARLLRVKLNPLRALCSLYCTVQSHHTSTKVARVTAVLPPKLYLENEIGGGADSESDVRSTGKLRPLQPFGLVASCSHHL